MTGAETQLLTRPQIGDGLPSVLLGTVGLTPVYHHTDTARLPWILRAGELRPGANRIGGYPDPDFIWATTECQGDMTASADRGEHYRSGKTRHVRFTVARSLFFPRRDVAARHPDWTQDQIHRLEKFAQGKSRPSSWWCADKAIPLSEWLAIDTRSYREKRWVPFDPSTTVVDLTESGQDRWLGVIVAGMTFASKVYRGPLGQAGYQVRASP